MIQCGSYVGLLIVCICIYSITLYICIYIYMCVYVYIVYVYMHTSLFMHIHIYIWCACVCEPSQYMYFFTSSPLFDRPLLLLGTWFSNCVFAWGHRCDPGSCANEHGQMSQWYQRETSLSRTCSVLSIWFWSSWHGAQPRTSSPIFRFLHGSAICSSYCGRHGTLNPLAVAKALALAMVTLPTRLVFLEVLKREGTASDITDL